MQKGGNWDFGVKKKKRGGGGVTGEFGQDKQG